MSLSTKSSRMGRTGLIGIGLAVALLLAGCGGSDGASGDAAAEAQAAARATASAIASAVASAGGVAPVGTEDPAPPGGAVSAEDFCAALTKAQPKLDAQPSKDVAFVTLTLELANLYSEKNALPSMDASTMDALVETCPEAAAKALKATGKESFAEFR